jgi:hypothetical protein
VLYGDMVSEGPCTAFLRWTCAWCSLGKYSECQQLPDGGICTGSERILNLCQAQVVGARLLPGSDASSVGTVLLVSDR